VASLVRHSTVEDDWAEAASAHPLCVMCQKANRITIATEDVVYLLEGIGIATGARRRSAFAHPTR
jgi:hypothetical protein